MQRVLMKSKIHRAVVTRANPDYEGSCGIDARVMAAADILPGEQVHVVNVSNGSRAVTYAIEAGEREIALNGAMAQLGSVGDVVIIIAYASLDDSEIARFRPAVVQVDAANRVREHIATG